MKFIRFSCAAVAAVLFFGAALAIDPESLDDPALQARYQALTRELRCLQCQNETIADSNASLAGDLRRQVREMLLAGKSDDDILKYLTDRYGDFVLYQPPVAARTWILWLGPALLLLIAGGVAFSVVRQRAKAPFDDATDTAEDQSL